MNIDTFTSQFEDIVRPNRFRVDITGLPKPTLCTTVSGGNISFMTHPVTGRDDKPSINLPYEIQKEPLTMTFYNDSEMANWSFFEDWQYGNSKSTYNFLNNSFAYFYDYTKDVNVQVIDRKGSSIYEFDFYDCYITNLQKGDFNSASQNELQTFTVTLEFEDFG